MAKSGIIYGSRQGNAYGPRLELHWSIVSQDIAKNTSNVKVISIFNVNAEISYGSNAGRSGSTTLGGSTKSYVSPTHSRTARTRALGTTYHTVSHSSDGSFSGTLSGTFDIGQLDWGGVSISRISASGNIVLDEIVRGIDESSVMLATGWGSVTGNKTITFTKLSTTATVQVTWRYWIGKSNAWSGVMTKSSNYTSSTAIAFTSSEITSIHNNNPNTKTVKVQVFIRHFQGSTLIGSVTKELTMSLEQEAPAITLSATCTGTNQAVLGATNRGLINIHNGYIKVSATAKNGASVSRYQIDFQGLKYSDSSISVKLNRTGNIPVTVTVWDSRGISATASATIVSYAYTLPKLSNVSAARYTGSTLDPLGTDYKVSATIASTTVAPSGNNVNISSWKIDSGSIVNSSAITQSGTLPIESSKKITITYYDKFSGNLIYVLTVPTAQATLVLGKNSVGVGMVPPPEGSGLYVKDGIKTSVMRALHSFNERIFWAESYTTALPAYYTHNDIANYLAPADITDYGWNLNYIEHNGIYIQRMTANAKPELNYPFAIAGKLEHIMMSNFRYQTYTTYTGEVACRAYYNGTWRPWKKVNLIDL